MKPIFYKKRTQKSVTKLFGEANGEVSFSFRMDPHTVKVSWYGVCILLNPSLNCDFDNLQKDQNGRMVLVDLSLNSSKFSSCNIYVPNDQRKQQQAFFQDPSAYLMSNTDTERLIVGGDWNITLQPFDKRGGTPWKSTIARDKLLTIMKEFAVVDIFRKRNQHKTNYTYESKALKMSSWIDFFLIAQHLTNCAAWVETKVSNTPYSTMAAVSDDLGRVA